MGTTDANQKQAASYFREPWKYTDSDIQTLVRCTKKQFFHLALTCDGAQLRNSNLNVFGRCFLMLYKLCHQVSFAILATLSGMKHSKVASDIFYRHLLHQYKFNCNIPKVIHNGTINQVEIDKLLHQSHQRTPIFYKVLLKDFEDPKKENRIPVPLNLDGTYIDIAGSDDIELQKFMYYQPRANHVCKLLNLTDMAPKFVGLLPVASSQSPSSGDGLLLAKHIELQDSDTSGQYIRSILRGNATYFVILIVDAGFVIKVPNAPVESRGPNSVTLASVCRQENCVLLHTSSRYERYHLERTEQGKIRKVDWTPGKPSLDENVINFSRKLRKSQEALHATLKQNCKVLDMRHIWNESLLPLSGRQLERFGLPDDYKDVPKLSFIVTVCCSLVNAHHPGFYPKYMDSGAGAVRSANIFNSRLFLENPLLHEDIWPTSFTAARTAGTNWVELRFGDLAQHD